VICIGYDFPWLVTDDFNERMWGFEHFSATPTAENHMAALEILLTCVGLLTWGSRVCHTRMMISELGMC
jgi:hypothetical protein